jgi:hypothetical protein
MIPMSESSDALIHLRTAGPARVMASTSRRKQIMKPADSGITKARQHKGPAQRAQQASNESTAKSTEDLTRNAIMPKGGNQIGLLSSDLSSLRSRYFATLVAALFASGEPFNDFMKMSPKFLETSRTAFENIWPHLSISVETDDVLFNVVSLIPI